MQFVQKYAKAAAVFPTTWGFGVYLFPAKLSGSALYMGCAEDIVNFKDLNYF